MQVKWTEPPSELSAAFCDPLDQINAMDRQDWTLVRLVICVAVAVVALALASPLLP